MHHFLGMQVTCTCIRSAVLCKGVVILFQASKEQNIPKEKLYKSVQNILDEIGCDRQMPVIRWLGLLLLKVLKRTRSSLCVNETSVKRVSYVVALNWSRNLAIAQ
jgi:hypothetical protein